MSQEDTIAVVIPAYKGARFIRAAMDSVVLQTFAPSETIVVDDGSPDDSGAIAASYGPRVRLICQENAGMTGARNRGVREARSSWIAFLDQDDICHENRLQRTAQAIRSNPSARWFYSHYTVIDTPSGCQRYVHTPNPIALQKELRFKCPVIPSISVIHRGALLEVGGFPEGPDFKGIDDHLLILRFMRRFGPSAFAQIRESLSFYTVHSESYGGRPWDINRARLAILNEQLADLRGIERWAWARILMARLQFDTAVTLRERRDNRHLAYVLRSIMQWPFIVGNALPATRYKVLTHMLLTRLKISLQVMLSESLVSQAHKNPRGKDESENQ